MNEADAKAALVRLDELSRAVESGNVERLLRVARDRRRPRSVATMTTAKQWPERALKAEAEVERLRAGIEAERQIKHNLMAEVARLTERVRHHAEALNEVERLRDELGSKMDQAASHYGEVIERLRGNLAFNVSEVERLSKEVERLAHRLAELGYTPEAPR